MCGGTHSPHWFWCSIPVEEYEGENRSREGAKAQTGSPGAKVPPGLRTAACASHLAGQFPLKARQRLRVRLTELGNRGDTAAPPGGWKLPDQQWVSQEGQNSGHYSQSEESWRSVLATTMPSTSLDQKRGTKRWVAAVGEV